MAKPKQKSKQKSKVKGKSTVGSGKSEALKAEMQKRMEKMKGH